MIKIQYVEHFIIFSQSKSRLVDADRLAHGALDEQGAHVLPVLLQQGHQKVDRHHGVGGQLILGHGDVANGNTQTQDLLQLEFDGSTDFLHFGLQVVAVADGGGELASLVQTRTQKSGNLLDDRVRGQEGIKLGSQLFDLLLALVQLFQVFNALKGQTSSLGLITVLLVTQNAHGQAGLGGVGQADGTRETLVTLRVVVLETDLQLDGFVKVALVFGVVRVGKEVVHALADGGSGQLATTRMISGLLEGENLGGMEWSMLTGGWMDGRFMERP